MTLLIVSKYHGHYVGPILLLFIESYPSSIDYVAREIVPIKIKWSMHRLHKTREGYYDFISKRVTVGYRSSFQTFNLWKFS